MENMGGIHIKTILALFRTWGIMEKDVTALPLDIGNIGVTNLDQTQFDNVAVLCEQHGWGYAIFDNPDGDSIVFISPEPYAVIQSKVTEMLASRRALN